MILVMGRWPFYEKVIIEVNSSFRRAHNWKKLFSMFFTIKTSFTHKVNLFWEGHKILINLYHRRTNLRWWFRKILWPSQNKLTLMSNEIGRFFQILWSSQNKGTVIMRVCWHFLIVFLPTYFMNRIECCKLH